MLARSSGRGALLAASAAFATSCGGANAGITSASAGASGIEQAGSLANLVALTGLTPKLEDLAVSAVDTNVKVAFSVDEQAMRSLLVLLPKHVH